MAVTGAVLGLGGVRRSRLKGLESTRACGTDDDEAADGEAMAMGLEFGAGPTALGE